MKQTTRLLILNSMICLGLWGSSTYTPTAWSATTPPASETVIQPVQLTYTPAEVSRQIQKIEVPASTLPLTPEKALRHLPSSGKLLKSQATPMGTILLYTKKDDPENFYAAYISKDKKAPLRARCHRKPVVCQLDRYPR